MKTQTTKDREIVISRVYDAPPELVWRAWTDPEQVVRWWGPIGFTTTTRSMDVRPGGTWRFVMHGPDGRDYGNRIVFDEVVAPERLVYIHDDDGDEAIESVKFRTTVTFERQGEKTRLTMHMVFPSREERDRIVKEHGAVEGGIQHVTRLAEHLAKATGSSRHALVVALPSEREVILRRLFDAPRRLVFEAFTRPEHIRRWWGPRAYAMTVCEMDFRVGGSWRFVQRTPDGQEHPFTGVYKEIAAPERIVQTFIYDVEGIRDQIVIETITFEEQDGKTILTNTAQYPSPESRDGYIDSGMEWGAIETMDRLGELVATMRREPGAPSEGR
jgi:uncharacterized protein YndB with AHSA1/START domain